MTDTTFFPSLLIASNRLTLNEPLETARFADGSVVSASLGAALWQGETTVILERHTNVSAYEARLAKLQRAGETFFAYDPRFNGPQADPGGVVLGASTPTIHTLDADNKRLRVTGLPAGYVLSAGDYIGWEYGSNPTRYALHRLVANSLASGTGLTPLFEVAPFIRPGVTTGTAVTLIRPVFKARLLEVEYGVAVPVNTGGASIKYTQVLR